MKKISLCGVLAVMLALPLSAVPPKYIVWGEGAVKWLMTKEEAKQWKSVKTDDEAQAFVDLFWARRDPTPATARNEFKEDFDARVKFADDNFGDGRVPGSLTDRGRAFILLGPPYRVSGQAGGNTPGGQQPLVGGRSPVDITPYGPTSQIHKQYWMYEHEKKPKYIQQADFTLVFSEESRNDWHIATTERTNPEALFMQAVNAFIVNPKLTKAPVFESPKPVKLTSFRNPELKTAYDEFKTSGKPSIGASSLTWGEFVSSEGERFVSAQMYAPSGSGLAAGQKVDFFSILENSAGEIVDVRENDLTMLAAGQDAYVDKSIPVEPGTYTATFGIAADGKVIAASKTQMTIEGLDPKATGVSPLLIASSVYPMTSEWRPTDPFTFGGLKVVPKGDSVFSPSGDLWYFVELRNPGVTDAGTPNVRVQVDIKGKTATGSKVQWGQPMKDANLAKLTGETTRFGLGLAIPLEGFKPGEYSIKVHVVDVVLGKDYSLEKQFRVRG
jgi:GWxTD domain-containing protein